MDFSVVVVPIQVDANVSVPCPIGAEGVMRFDNRFEVQSMLLSYILYPEIVNYEGEADWSPLVFPEAWNNFTLVVAVFVEPFFKEFVGNETRVR